MRGINLMYRPCVPPNLSQPLLKANYSRITSRTLTLPTAGNPHTHRLSTRLPIAGKLRPNLPMLLTPLL
jgi:hypothetical protein